MDNNIPSPSGKKTWQVSTVESILTNEKYKGAALLQKTFTVDFLTKKIKVNEGEVPQYYVQDSHPAIVDTDVFDLVQIELARRKELKGQYSGNGFLGLFGVSLGDNGGGDLVHQRQSGCHHSGDHQQHAGDPGNVGKERFLFHFFLLLNYMHSTNKKQSAESQPIAPSD